MTKKPSRARRLAVAAPRPRLEPVITATLRSGLLEWDMSLTDMTLWPKRKRTGPNPRRLPRPHGDHGGKPRPDPIGEATDLLGRQHDLDRHALHHLGEIAGGV